MTYWLLTTEYPPFHGGGISTYAHATARMLQEKGHNVTVILYDLSVSEDQISIEDGVRVIRFLARRTGSHKFLGFNAYISYEYASIVKSLIIEEGIPDIIESQEYHGIAYYIQQFKLLQYDIFKDLNIVITSHAPAFIYLAYNQVPVYRFPEYWTGQMEKSSLRSADILIAPSRYIVSEMKSKMNWEGLEERYVVNPIYCDELPVAVPEFIQNRVVCFGKLSPLKGTFELLNYFEALWNENIKVQLQIIGSTHQIFHPEGCTMGDYVNRKYKRFIRDGLLVLRGQLTQEQSKRELLNSHVVVVPSIVDNLPYTVIEAMSLGKVVLASRQGGQSEVIKDGINGFLFDHNTPDDFKSKILHVLSLPTSSINELGRNAATSVREAFSPEVVYEQKMSIIMSYLASNSKRKSFPLIESPQKCENYTVNIKDTNSLLSVVIPYYNMGEYIEDCVKSIYASEYSKIEVIIIDDGSNDANSIEKLIELQSKYPINVYSKGNEGLAQTRNYGAQKAKGDFLAFLDADDMVDKTYYSKSIEVLSKYDNVHFIGCWTKYFGDSTDSWPTFNPEPPYLLVHNMINSSSLVYKKNSFLSAGQNEKALIYGMEDWESVISMVSSGLSGVVLPEFLFKYRVRKGSMARSFTRIKRLYLRKLITEKHSVIYQKYGVEISNLLNSNGSGLDFDNPTFATSVGLSFPLSNAIADRIKEKVKQNKILKQIAYRLYNQIKK